MLCAVCGHSFGCDVKSVLRSKDTCAGKLTLNMVTSFVFAICVLIAHMPWQKRHVTDTAASVMSVSFLKLLPYHPYTINDH